jgi:two-component system cell cycle response regulator
MLIERLGMNIKHSVLVAGPNSIPREHIVEILDSAEITKFFATNSAEAEILISGDNNNVSTIILVGPDWDEQSLSFLKNRTHNPVQKSLPVIAFVENEASASHLDETLGLKIQIHTMADREHSVISTIESSVLSYIHSKELLDELGDRTSAIGLIRSGTFELRTPEEADRLTTMLSLACPEPTTVALGFLELILNAIEHGNLNIGYDLKTQELENGTWPEKIKQRLESDKYKDRVVTVKFACQKDEVSLEVIDQGDGFDWQKYASTPTLDPYALHGRGILYATSIDAATLTYKGNGNHVVLTINTNK